MADISPLISSLGVGSGLDLTSLLGGLKTAEQQRLQPLQVRNASYQSQLSAYGVLTGVVLGLQSAAGKLNDHALFQASKASVTGAGVSASSSAEAVPGSYNVAVSQLAQAQSLATVGQTDKAAAIGEGGTITLNVGDNDPVVINVAPDKSSLEGIRDAINGAHAGVSASLINDGSATPWRLVLSSDASGTASQISLTAVDGPGAVGTPLADLLGYDSDAGSGVMTETVAARDAQLTVNGIPITSSSNKVEGAIQGVTLTLEATTAGAQVDVKRDATSARSAIDAFVSAYNNYRGKLNELTAFNGADSKSNGVLLGDSAARSVASELSSALGSQVSGGSLSALADIGISLQAGGTLKVDGAKLDDALASDPDAVARLFAGDPAASGDRDGVAGTLLGAISRLVDGNGLLTNASAGVQGNIDRISKRIDSMQERIDATVERYRQQFVKLDSLMANFNSVSSYLSNQLSQLGAQNKK